MKSEKNAWIRALIMAAALLTPHVTHAYVLSSRPPLSVPAVSAVREIASAAVSPDGAWVEIQYMPGTSAARGTGRTVVVNLKNGRQFFAGQTATELDYESRWSPDSSRLAYVAQDEHATHLEVMDVRSQLKSSVGGVHPRADGEGRRGTLTWVDDEQILVIAAPAAQLAPGVATEHDESCDANEVSSKCDLLLVNVTTGKSKTLARSTPIRYAWPSPDGSRVVYAVHTGSTPNTQASVHDLHLLDLKSGADALVASRFAIHYPHLAGWSPNGHYFGLISNGQTYDGRMSFIQIEANDAYSFHVGHGPEDCNQGYSSPPAWDFSGSDAFCTARDGESLWRVSASSGTATRIGAISGHSLKALFVPANDLQRPAKELFVATIDNDTEDAGVFAVDIASGKSRRIVERAAWMSNEDRVSASDDYRTLTWLGGDPGHFGGVTVVNTVTGNMKPVSAPNSQEAFSRGRSELMHWLSVKGERLRGALLLPPGYRAGDHVPLVVWIYPGAKGSEYVNRMELGMAMPVFNLQLLASRGYAVLDPDAPFDGRTITRDLVDDVMPGINQLIERGIVDPQRLAVMGQSYGSFGTLALITQSTRFKAAIITGVVDPDVLGQYFQTSPGSRQLIEAPFYENGGGKMGATPWQSPYAYLENSPVLRFPDVETPVLIGDGTVDPMYEAGWPDSVYAALRRLGKPTEYLTYAGEGHVISTIENVSDFWNIRLRFLAEHLNIRLDDAGRIEFKEGSVVPRQ